MRFLCRIGWHDWQYRSVFKRTIQYVDEKGRPTYEERYDAQERVCKRCRRVAVVKV